MAEAVTMNVDQLLRGWHNEKATWESSSWTRHADPDPTRADGTRGRGGNLRGHRTLILAVRSQQGMLQYLCSFFLVFIF